MSCAPCVPCRPVQHCEPENFGLLFPSLVGPMGPPGGPLTFLNNYGELRALDPSEFPQGYVGYVGGYANPTDGGFGYFVYDATSTDPDNDGTIIMPANGIGRWKRELNGWINPVWFGADPTGTANSTGPIRNAIAAALLLTQTSVTPGYASSLTTTNILFPDGIFYVDDDLS